MNPRLELINLNILRNQNKLINNITLSLMPGEIVSIIGPNGCGKTTLLKTLAGLHNFTHGKIKIDGHDLFSMTNQQRARAISMLFQSSPLQPYCIAKDRIAHGLMPHLGINYLPSLQEKFQIESLAYMLNINHLLKRPLAHMSGGELRLVNLAKCLINTNTKILLLDEPSVFLDINQKNNLASVLKNHAKLGHLVIFSSHDLDFINRCANKTIEIKHHELALNILL